MAGGVRKNIAKVDVILDRKSVYSSITAVPYTGK